MKTCPSCQNDCADDTQFCPKCGQNVAEVEAYPDDGNLTGRVIAGNFKLGEQIGSGAMGAIYKAEQLSLGKTVAMKLLHRHLLSDPTLIKRFHREARAAARFKHANAIDVIDFGQAENGTLFIAMEFVDGRDLADVIHTDYPLGYERIIKILKQVCLALDEAHAVRIIHRDLKPENIMLENRRNQHDFVKVLDFGIAKIQDPHTEGAQDSKQGWQTVAGMVCGTPEYMAPEQARGEKLDARADLYALGVLVYQMLTGQLPFTGDSPIGVVTQHLTEPVPRVSDVFKDVHPAAEELVTRLLQKDRERRPDSAMVVFHELEMLEKQVLPRARITRTGSGRSAGAPDAADAVTHSSDTKLISAVEATGLVAAINRPALAPATEAGLADPARRTVGTPVWPWIALAAILVGVLAWGISLAVQARPDPAADPSQDMPVARLETPGTEPPAVKPSLSEPREVTDAADATKTASEAVALPASPVRPAIAVRRDATTAQRAGRRARASAVGAGSGIVQPAPLPKSEERARPPASPVAGHTKPSTPTHGKPANSGRPHHSGNTGGHKPANTPHAAARLAKLEASAKRAKSAGNWPGAIADYSAAYKLKRRSKYLKEIGRAYAKAGNMPKACSYFARYVKRFKGQARVDAAGRLAFYHCELGL